MELTDAIRSRRTWKSFGGDPLSREELEQLFELARWAPNHKLTEPWRFRVIGPDALDRLREVVASQARESAPEGADIDAVVSIAVKKLERAPTIVAVSSIRNPDPKLDVEDFSSSSVAAYILLLAAADKGYASFWRSPGVLQSVDGSAAIGLGPGEEALGLIYLGKPGPVPPKPGVRSETDSFVTYLD
ncbi:MAG: nitroreductase family protein [Solirubrobacterales bacterium]